MSRDWLHLGAVVLMPKEGQFLHHVITNALLVHRPSLSSDSHDFKYTLLQQQLTDYPSAWLGCRQPMLRMVGPPLTAIGAFVGQWGSQAMLWARSCGLATHAILKTLFGPPMLHLLHFLRLVGQTLLPLWLVRRHPMLDKAVTSSLVRSPLSLHTSLR